MARPPILTKEALRVITAKRRAANKERVAAYKREQRENKKRLAACKGEQGKPVAIESPVAVPVVARVCDKLPKLIEEYSRRFPNGGRGLSSQQKRERKSLYDRIYRERNKETTLARKAQYRKDNPEDTFIRKSLCRVLGGDNFKGTYTRAVKLIGYTKEQLREHIESQFVDGMGWDNKSEWHIDHIKPVSVFLKEGITDPKVINALSNLQPLWAKDNLSKGSNY